MPQLAPSTVRAVSGPRALHHAQRQQSLTGQVRDLPLQYVSGLRCEQLVCVGRIRKREDRVSEVL